MRSRIEDGAGTTTKPGVFEHKLRTLDVTQSLTNHISTSELNGRTGVFTVRNFENMAATLGILLSISNNDPLNLLVIDNMYIQVTQSNVNLPIPTVIASVSKSNALSTNLQPFINENKSSNIIIPLVTKLRGGGGAGTVGIIKMFPTLGDVIELIPPGSDGIVLSGGPNTNSFTDNNRTISVVFQLPAGASLFVNSFIRFMMVPPDILG